MALGTHNLKRFFSQNKILALLFAIVVIWLFFEHLTDGAFLTPRKFSNQLRQMAITGMLASGLVFIIISGEIDLSVGASLGMLGGIAAILDYTYHLPVPVTIADGAQTQHLGNYTFAIIRRDVDDILTSTDHELVEAMRQIAATGKGPENQVASIGCSLKWKAR